MGVCVSDTKGTMNLNIDRNADVKCEQAIMPSN